MKTYTTKSNAKRAARSSFGKDAIEGKDFIIEGESNAWFFTILSNSEGIDQSDTLDLKIVDQPVIEEEAYIPGEGGDFEDYLDAALTQQEESIETSTEPQLHRKKSAIEKPCVAVWRIAECMLNENPDVSRKEIVAACEKAGIAFYTARTQYQLWRQAHNTSAKK